MKLMTLDPPGGWSDELQPEIALSDLQEFWARDGDDIPNEIPAGIKYLDSAEFDAAHYAQDYLVDEVLCRGQPAVIGGAPKTLKTLIAVDLALSLGCGRPFLGQFNTKPANVGIISGESGAATLQEAARRISRSKGCSLKQANVFWSFEIPCITSPAAQDAIRRWVEERELEVLIVDPTYLALLDMSSATSAGNVFVMGAALHGFVRVLASTGLTLILIHHFSKHATRSRTADGLAPDLSDLAMSGLAEFVRQWILLRRLQSYVIGSGHHSLLLNAGGSAGHSGLYALEIHEGMAKDADGRRWDVRVMQPEEARSDRQRVNTERKRQHQLRMDEETKAKVREYLETKPIGDTRNEIRHVVGVGKERLKSVVNQMLKAGELEECVVEKHTRTESGVRLPQCGGPLDSLPDQQVSPPCRAGGRPPPL